VCEEASCPNIGEGGDKGTATFMIIGDRWTRRCPFCYVGHGRPDPLDINEPANLAKTIVDLKLSYAVITSVDRDAPRDDGAGHFVDCVHKTRELLPRNKIEVQVPNFRGRLEKALKFFADGRPDVLNDKLGPVPRLHEEARPGADYKHSLGSPSN
jgi:lipoic acid synthetase